MCRRLCGVQGAGLVVVMLLGAGIGLPLLYILRAAMEDSAGNFGGIAQFLACLEQPAMFAAVLNSLCISTATACIAVLLGWFLACSRVHGPLHFSSAYGTHPLLSKAMFLAPLLPLFAPPIFPAIGLVYLFGTQGVLHYVTNGEVYGALGILTGEVICSLPHALLLLTAALRGVDTRLYEAARVLGASPWKLWRTVTFPAVRYGAICAWLTSFVLSLADVGVPAVLGSDFPMLSTELYKLVAGERQMGPAAVLCMGMLAPCVVYACFESRFREQFSAEAQGSRRLPVPRIQVLYDCGNVFTVAGILVVLFGVLHASVVTFWPYDVSLTLNQYRDALDNILPLWISFKLALSAMLCGTCLAWVNAYMRTRCTLSAWIQQLGNMLAILPSGIPGMALGVAYVLAFSHLLERYTFCVMTLYIVMHFYSTAYMMNSTHLLGIDSRYEEAGLTTGTRRVQTIWRVILPLSRKNLADVALYYFINATTTMSGLIFLYDAENMPASVAMLHQSDIGNMQGAAALGCLILILNLTTVGVWACLDAERSPLRFDRSV